MQTSSDHIWGTGPGILGSLRAFLQEDCGPMPSLVVLREGQKHGLSREYLAYLLLEANRVATEHGRGLPEKSIEWLLGQLQKPLDQQVDPLKHWPSRQELELGS